MNSMIMYRNPLEQWFWEGGAVYVLGLLLVVWVALNAPSWWKAATCKHEKVWEDRSCNAHCRNCGKELGFIGKWRDKK